MDVIKVGYKGLDVGALSFDEATGTGVFQYTRDFQYSGIELSPIMMPLSNRIFSFPHLNFETFKGLPGMVADSLPDDFGNRILNAWVASQGRDAKSITPLERLRYTGTRGMGALEYSPAEKMKGFNASRQVEIAELLKIAQEVLDTRSLLEVELKSDGADDKEAMLALLSVGTSAGGARPKAVLAFNEDFTQVRSGQTDVPDGFTHYLMKFDGVSEHNKDKETFGDPAGYGAMEYVYYQMATQCGITMMPCKLLQEGDRQHFITQRFDRVRNKKVHVQTLNGLAHIDYKAPGSFSYAELFGIARKLNLGITDAEQLLKRMIFNIVAKNHDDHAKNFGFVLDGDRWVLSPAYDVAFSFKDDSAWVRDHWMSLNGKRNNFELKDFHSLSILGKFFSEKRINEELELAISVVSNWRKLALDSNVPERLIKLVESNVRLKFE